MKSSRARSSPPVTTVVMGGILVALVGVLIDVRSLLIPPVNPNACDQVVRSQSVLSRQHLQQVLQVSEHAAKATVRAIVGEPYCVMSRGDRDVYPLAFDPDTWFVIVYEGDAYAGYEIRVRR